MNIASGTPVRVPVNGTIVNTRVDGVAGAPWLVFCNPLSADLSLWDRQAAAFSDRYRILRYDQRGHGASDVPPDHKTTFDELSSDLVGLLDHYQIDKAVLAGVSMGATTVMRFAARFPYRCRAVIACDGQWHTAPDSEGSFRERMETAKTHGMAALAEPTARRWFLPDFYEKNPELMRRIQAMVAATPVGGYLACVEALLNFDLRSDFPSIRVPSVLYLVGQKDGNLPEVMMEMAQATLNSRYEVVYNCGHLPMIEQPEAFYAVVDGFLKDLELP